MADRQASNAVPDTANAAWSISEARQRRRFYEARGFRSGAVLQRHGVGGPLR